MIILNGSEEDSLILRCVRLGEVTWAGATRGARLALEDALVALAAKLLKVLGLDLLPRRLACLLVGGDRGEDGQEVRVQVGVGEQTRTREEHLDVGLVGEVARSLLEDDQVEGEALAQRPHHGELVEQAVISDEGLVVLAGEVLPAGGLIDDGIS